MNRVLIIEDDKNIAELEKDYLEANGIAAVIASDGLGGLKEALENDYSLILLDIMLPSADGFAICKRIRDEKNTPIIFVSAKKEDFDKIKGLGLGADDYVVKPFSPSELVARVKAHISRYQRLTANGESGEIIEIDKMRIDNNSGMVTISGKELNLTKKEFQVLYLLASQPDVIFSKNELFEKVWGYDSLGDTSTLTVHINRLREKIKEADENAEFIKTIWSRGYRFR